VFFENSFLQILLNLFTTGEAEVLAKLSPLPSVVDFFSRVLSQVDVRSKGKSKQSDVSGEGFVKQLLGVSRPYTEAACRLLDRYLFYFI
jgi:hypothetical protein